MEVGFSILFSTFSTFLTNRRKLETYKVSLQSTKELKWELLMRLL